MRSMILPALLMAVWLAVSIVLAPVLVTSTDDALVFRAAVQR